MSRVVIGTSGWAYKHWKHYWYEGRPMVRWLEYISEKLSGVEVDGTFYGQQKRHTFENWANRTRPDFRFAIRGHRYVTHRKKLVDVADSVQRVKEPAQGLGEKLMAVLWQLPPFMRKDAERLTEFAKLLQTWPRVYHAMEFRHASWFDNEIAGILDQHGLVNTISDSGSFKRWDRVTGNAVYVRLHGKPHTYHSSYTDQELDEWAAKCRAWHKEGKDVMVFFDNDSQIAAPWNALHLQQRLPELTIGEDVRAA